MDRNVEELDIGTLLFQRNYLADQLKELRRLIHMIYQVNEETAREYAALASSGQKGELSDFLDKADGLREANQNIVRILRKEGFTVI